MDAPPYSPISVPSPQVLSTPLHIPAITSTPTLQVSQQSLNSQLDSDIELQRRSVWCGFVLVGDNIDKSVYALHQTMESRNRSLHYFNSCAVLDRCDFSHLSDFQSPPDRNSYDVSHLLPFNEDLEAILLRFATLVGRMLTTHVPGFEKYYILYFSNQAQILYRNGKEIRCGKPCMFVTIVLFTSDTFYRYLLESL